jgi:glycosyltransferase involved in cell wall biosynthesis
MTTSQGARPHPGSDSAGTAGAPLSIAHVLVSLEMGGAERLVVDVARAQAEQGHRVAVFVLSKSANPILQGLLSEAGLPVIAFERRPGIDLRLIPRLAFALRRCRPDIVHTHNEPPLIYGTPAARLIGATAIHTCHGPRSLSRGAKLLARAAARLTHRYVAVTGAVVEELSASGDVPRDKLLVIENGVNLNRFRLDRAQGAEIRRRFGIPETAYVVGSVGRLAPEKNFGFLMRAVEPLLAAGAHLLLVGDGAERGRLEAQAAASASPAAIHFAGAQADVAPFLAAMDTFSLSSTFEGLPLALLEAMATSRTVVAHAIGGIPLVVEDGVTGLLTTPEDQAGFTAALLRVRDDKVLAKSLGEAGSARAIHRYGLHRMLDEYMAVYRQALASR